MALAAIPVGLGIGLSLGMLGGGGSVLAVPVLVDILGQGVHQATTTSLVVVTVGAVVGGLSHAREGRVCWRHAIAFSGAAIPGVIVGTVLGQAVSEKALIAAFAVIMLVAVAATRRKARQDAESPTADRRRATCPPLRLAGVVTAIITGTSPMALVPHLASGPAVDLRVILAMTGACVAGALGGVRLAGRVSHPRLAEAFTALVVVVAAYLLIFATVLGGPPGSS